jgi:hypothetical protein
VKHLVIALLLVSSAAFAQDKKPKCGDEQAATGKGTKYEVVIGPDGKKVFKIKTGFVICGKVPKPDVLYGLLNSTINYEWETLKQDFLPKITRSVEKPPF